MEPNSQKMMFSSSEFYASWTVVTSEQYTNVSPSTNINFPAGYQAGDAIIALHIVDVTDASTPSTPAGWTLIQSTRENDNDTGKTLIVVSQILQRVTTETFYTTPSQVQSNANWRIVLIVLRPPSSFDTSSLQLSLVEASDEFGGSEGDSGTYTISTPSITTLTNGALVFTIGATTENVSTFTARPSGYDILTEYAGSVGYGYGIYYKIKTVAGLEDPGNISFTGSGTEFVISHTFSLRSSRYTLKTNLSNFPNKSQDVGGIVTESNAATVAIETSDGSNQATISISGGNSAQYKINSGAWTSSPGTISNGDTLTLRQTSVTGTKGTSTSSICTVSLTYGGITENYTYNLITRREIVLNGASSTLVISTGISSLTIVGTGAGGGGGLSFAQISPAVYRGGGGGGGGAMATLNSLAVSAADSISLLAGSGGTGNGANTTVVRSGTTLLRAVGGTAGTAGTSTTAGTGGAGGSGASCIGDTKFSGGRGGNGTSSSAAPGATNFLAGGGGGAGGYSGVGGQGADAVALSGNRGTGSAGAGGAAGGGAAQCGGGGTGVSGAGTSGASSTSGGSEGSPDAYASGGFVSGINQWGDNGGNSGGGGGGGQSIRGSGGDGTLRVTW